MYSGKSCGDEKVLQFSGKKGFGQTEYEKPLLAFVNEIQG